MNLKIDGPVKSKVSPPLARGISANLIEYRTRNRRTSKGAETLKEGEAMNLKIIIAFIILFIFLSPIRSPASMEILSEAELSRVIAGAGVDIDIKGSKARVTMDSFYVEDTDPDHDPRHKIEFNNIVIDGDGGYFSFDTPADKPISIDVGTDASGRTIAVFVRSQYTSPRRYGVGNLVFCGQELGSLGLENVTEGPSTLRTASHADGSCGVDFDYASNLDISNFRYTYNTTPQSLTASGIHLAESAAPALGPGDPPGDPAAWAFAGAFKAGDISNNPATIDVGTDAGDKTSMFLNLPMQGCLRIENVNFGGVNFGPCAIDGITVHKLQIRMPGS